MHIARHVRIFLAAIGRGGTTAGVVGGSAFATSRVLEHAELPAGRFFLKAAAVDIRAAIDTPRGKQPYEFVFRASSVRKGKQKRMS